MKQTKTTLKELTAMYRAVLRHGILCNAIALGLIAATPAMADNIVLEGIQLATTEGLNIGQAGDTVTITSTGDGLRAISTGTGANAQSKFANITADTINITSTSGGGDAGLWIQNNTRPEDGATTFSTVNLTANDINISGPSGVVVMSQGRLNIDGNTTITGGVDHDAILTRGFAQTKINQSGENTVKLTGNIDFNFDKDSSGTPIDALVDITLNGSESYWTGNTVVSYDDGVPPAEASYMDVSDATISLKNGATWNATKITDQVDYYHTALNNLNSDGGVVHANEAGAQMNVEKLTVGANGLTINGGELTVDNKLTSTGRTFVDEGAALTINATQGANFTSGSSAQGGALYNFGADEEVYDNVNEEWTIERHIGTVDIDGAVFDGNTASDQGGAIYNSGDMTLSNVTFTSNQVTGDSETSMGGAVYNSGTDDLDVGDYYMTSNGILTINNSTFGDKDDAIKGNIALRGGALAMSDSWMAQHGQITLNSTNFYGNKALGAADNYNSPLGGAIYNSDGTIIVNGATEFAGNKAEGYAAQGGAIYNADTMTFNDAVTFSGNTVEDTDGANGGMGGAIINAYGTSEMTFNKAATFTENKAIGSGDTRGGAVYNTADLTFANGASFTGNEAKYGAAVYNEGGADITLTDASFMSNTAVASGGAIYNEYDGFFDSFGTVNINAVNSDVVFSGNIANNQANDIYNGGVVNFDAAAGRSISLEGIMGGSSGARTINKTGAGTLNVSEYIARQTVNVDAGELHLTTGEANLYQSTVNVADGATINTIDDEIQNFADSVKLSNGALIKGDIDYGAGTADLYGAADGATSVTYKMANALGGDTQYGGAKTIKVVDGEVTVNKDASFAWFNSDKGLTLASTGNADGSVVVTGTAGGIADAATATETVSFVDYSLTADESLDTDKEIKSNFVLNGDGTESTDKGLTLNADLGVANGADLTLNEVKLAGVGELNNAAGATLRINDSKIGVNIRNFGLLYSDPTTFSGVVDNAAGATSNFDNDTFDATAELANAGTANLKNNVTFETGAKITGAGTVNMLSGTTAFNNTANSNLVTMANGAGFSGTLIGGSLDTRNNNIDTGLGTVQNANLYVDASLKGTPAIDAFAGTTGSTIKAINLTSSEYGTADSVTLAVGDATLDSDLQITGAMNYYTKVEKDGTNLVFSDKLVNASGMKANARLADYDNTTSGLTATTLQGAIDENATNVATINGTLATYGDVVTHAATDFATAAQGATADATAAAVNHATTGLAATKAIADASAATIATYGDVVTHDAADFATAAQGATADATAATVATYGDVVTHNVAEFATAAQGATADATAAAVNHATTGLAATKAIADASAATIATYGDVVTHNVAEFATAAQGTKADSAIQSVKVNGTALTPDAAKAVDITAVTGIKIGTGAAQSGEVTLGTTAATNLAANLTAATPTDAEIATWAVDNAANVATVGTTFDVLSKKLMNVQSDLMADGDNASSIARALGAVDGEHTTLIAQVNSMADARIAASTVDAADLHTAILTIDGSSAEAKDKRNALGALLTTGANAGKTLTAASTAEAVAEYMKLSADVMSEYDFGWDLNTGLQNDLVAGKMKIDVLNDSSVTDKTVAGAINANTAAIANIATTATAAYDQAHDWAESLLGVDVDTGVSHQLQDALTSNDVIGAANNFADALSALDAQTYANKNNIGTLTGLNTTDQSNLVAAVNEVVGDITVGAGTYNYISAGANVAGNLTALDTGLKAAADKNGVQDTGLANLAARLGVTYTAADGSVSATDYASNNYVTDGDSVVTAVGKLDTAIATAATTVTNAYNQAHAWAEGLLGVDVDEGTDNQLQNALTGLGGTTTIAGGTTTIVGALKDLDTGIENLTTDTTTGAINVASANIGAGGLAVAGDTTLTGLLTANGGINTTTLTTTGDTSVGGNLAVTGTTTLTGLLTANGGISTTTLATSGDATVGGDFAVTGDTALTGDLTVGGDTTLTGLLTANGGISTTDITASGDVSVGGDFAVTGATTLTGALNGSTATFSGALSADSVAATNGVSGKTLSATDSITLGSNTVTSIDTAGLARGVAGNTGVLATTASVTTTIANQAQDATYTNTVTSGSNVTGTTLNAAIANLDSVIGNRTYGNQYNITDGETITASVDHLDQAVGNRSYTNDYNITSTESVTQSLNKIDAAIGNRASLGSANTAVNTAIATSVASAVKTIGDEIGSQTYVNNMAVSYDAIAANTNLTNAVSQLASDIGTATTSAKNGVVAGNTVNANIDAINNTIGNIASLSARNDATSVGNALANGGTTTPTTVVAALNNIDATLGTVHNLSGKLTTAGTYKGNLANGTWTTVEDHLVAVDTSIGDRSSLASLNTAINNAAKTDVATALETTGNLIGNMTFDGSNYLASVTDLSEAVRVLDSNIAKVDHKVEKLERKVNSGMASMAALTALVPNARDCGDTQVSIGTGAYADRAGVAVGAFHYFNDHVLVNVGASYGGTSDMAFRAGITFGL